MAIQWRVCNICCHSGKLVEEEEGNFALWLSYILTGAGANVVSWLVLPRNAVSIGASGAVFGLFAVSVLVKVNLEINSYRLVETLVLEFWCLLMYFASDVLQLEEDPRSTNFGTVCRRKGTPFIPYLLLTMHLYLFLKPNNFSCYMA